MTLAFVERLSDSAYVETVTHGYSLSDGAPTRPAEIQWHMVIVKIYDTMRMIVTGPLTASGKAAYEGGAEIVWIKFRLGAFMPHLPFGTLVDTETLLPDAASDRFWLKGKAWEYPTHENADTFIDRLVSDGILMYDPVIGAALEDEATTMPARTMRHHFLRATGMPQRRIRQFRRAQQAAALLEQGVPILDSVFELGYFDQPHLTRALKHFIGYTPSQIIAQSKALACRSVQDAGDGLAYDGVVLAEIG